MFPREPILNPEREKVAKRILLVDDDDLLVEMIKFRLCASGFEVRTAGNGVLALQTVEEESARFDLIILDASMPEMDGYEVLRRLRANPRWADLPVLMLSGRRKEKDVMAGVSAGANDYIAKPFRPDELVSRIGRFVE